MFDPKTTKAKKQTMSEPAAARMLSPENHRDADLKSSSARRVGYNFIHDVGQANSPPTQRQENKTRLPDALKTGGENLSGLAMNGTTQLHKAADSSLHITQPVIQRTVWKHDGATWQAQSSSSTDKNSYPHPATKYPNANKGDIYDQNTGIYTSPIANQIAAMGLSKRSMGFYDPRATTAYGYFNLSGKKQQGPHTMAHISKRVAMAAGVMTGRDPLKLRGSRAIPRPRIVNKMLRDRLIVRGPNWKSKTRKIRTRFLKQYMRYYRAIKNAKTLAARLKATRGAMELNPATVYNIGKGKTSSSEIAGKGESRQKGADDWTKLLNTQGDLTSDSGLQTMDLSGANPLEKKQALRMVTAIRDLLKTNEPAEDSGDSESDSELDLDDD